MSEAVVYGPQLPKRSIVERVLAAKKAAAHNIAVGVKATIKGINTARHYVAANMKKALLALYALCMLSFAMYGVYLLAVVATAMFIALFAITAVLVGLFVVKYFVHMSSEEA